jgi:hypothetical protein
LQGYCAEFARATREEETYADQSPKCEVVRQDDVDSSAGRGGRGSGRPLRASAFALGGFDSSGYSFAYNLSYHSSHGQGREASPSERLIVVVASRIAVTDFHAESLDGENRANRQRGFVQAPVAVEKVLIKEDRVP